MVGVVIVVGCVGVAADGLFPPVGHTVLIGVPVGCALLLGIGLPTLAVGMFGNISVNALRAHSDRHRQNINRTSHSKS